VISFNKRCFQLVIHLFICPGTASLGPEHLGGVLDPDFKVHHTANLRVVDASAIPLSFSIAPLATVYAIAEKAADAIKREQISLHTDGEQFIVNSDVFL